MRDIHTIAQPFRRSTISIEQLGGSIFTPTVVGERTTLQSVHRVQGSMEFTKLALAFFAFAVMALPRISAAPLGMQTSVSPVVLTN